VIATVLFQVGGILGTLALAWLADRFGPAPVLGSAYLGGTILVAAVGQTGSEVALLFPAVFAAGFCLAGAQIGTHALTAMFYRPPSGRPGSAGRSGSGAPARSSVRFWAGSCWSTDGRRLPCSWRPRSRRFWLASPCPRSAGEDSGAALGAWATYKF
jgi:MFS family permease